MSQINVDAIRSANGTGDAISLTAADKTCTANITNNLSNRNLIINGDMNIWQRGDGPHTIAYSYSADRWERNFTLNGTDYFHIEKKTESPPGFSSSLEVSFGTAQASVTGGHYALIRQKIEAQNLQHLAYGTSSAKKMTLSFWVRSNKTGTYAVHLQQGDNSNKQVSFNYSISSADTWEKKTISIPADTSGVINNDNGEGITVTWHLVAGSDATSGTLRNTAWTTYAEADQAVGHNVNIGDSTSNTWYITGVQLEVGDYATDFEHRSYGDELARCQRYYYAHISALDSSNSTLGLGMYYSSSRAMMYVKFPVSMRTTPTAEITDVYNGYLLWVGGTYDFVDEFHIDTTNAGSVNGCELESDSEASGTTGYSCYVRRYTADTKQFSFSAEL